MCFIRAAFLLCSVVFFMDAGAQQKKSKYYNPLFGTEVRGRNAFSLGAGTSQADGDLTNPLFEFYGFIGYKRFIVPYTALSLEYHKFNVGYEDVYNEGFMSFDLNLELHPFPYNQFNIFVFGGGGLHASNYFKSSEYKVQGGAGIELLLTESVGLIVRGDLNKLFSDDLEGVVSGSEDDLYWRAAIGINFYFEKRRYKHRIKKGEPTIINSNPIIHQ